jgi:hypothetical protein
MNVLKKYLSRFVSWQVYVVIFCFLVLVSGCGSSAPVTTATKHLYLDTIEKNIKTGVIDINKWTKEHAETAGPFRDIHNQLIVRGIGFSSDGSITYNLNKLDAVYATFESDLYIEWLYSKYWSESTNKDHGTVIFSVEIDKKQVFNQAMTENDEPQHVKLDLPQDAKTLTLRQNKRRRWK